MLISGGWNDGGQVGVEVWREDAGSCLLVGFPEPRWYHTINGFLGGQLFSHILISGLLKVPNTKPLIRMSPPSLMTQFRNAKVT